MKVTNLVLFYSSLLITSIGIAMSSTVADGVVFFGVAGLIIALLRIMWESGGY